MKSARWATCITWRKMTKQLWEILVPTVRNTGKPYHLRYHRLWDEQVRKVSGGLTILQPVKGQWEDEAKLFNERMIPVRIACSSAEIEKIAELTLVHYNQVAVMYYLVSNYVQITRKKEVS
jgi:hypothetical protein